MPRRLEMGEAKYCDLSSLNLHSSYLLTDMRFECGKSLSFFAHPFDKTRFLNCGSGGKTYACSCPKGLTFSSGENVCTYSSGG